MSHGEIGDLPPDSSLEDIIRRWHAEEKESGTVLDFDTFEKKFHVLLGLSFSALEEERSNLSDPNYIQRIWNGWQNLSGLASVASTQFADHPVPVLAAPLRQPHQIPVPHHQDNSPTQETAAAVTLPPPSNVGAAPGNEEQPVAVDSLAHIQYFANLGPNAVQTVRAPRRSPEEQAAQPPLPAGLGQADLQGRNPMERPSYQIISTPLGGSIAPEPAEVDPRRGPPPAPATPAPVQDAAQPVPAAIGNGTVPGGQPSLQETEQERATRHPEPARSRASSGVIGSTVWDLIHHIMDTHSENNRALNPSSPHFANDVAVCARELHMDGSATLIAMGVIECMVQFREKYERIQRSRHEQLSLEQFAAEVLSGTDWTQYPEQEVEARIHAIFIAAGFQLENARRYLSQLPGPYTLDT